MSLRAVLALCIAAPACAWQVPGDLSKELSRAVEIASRGMYAEAERVLTGLESSHPTDPEIRYRLGLILLRQDKVEDAARRLEALAKTEPRSPLVWVSVAEVRFRLGDGQGAQAAADRAQSLAGDEPAKWRALAVVYARIGDFRRAAECEARWSEAVPGDSESLLRAIDLYLRAGNALEAIRLGQKALIERDSARLRFLLGTAHRQHGDVAQAVEEFQAALRMDSGQPPYYVELARVFIDHQALEPARIVLESALRRSVVDPDILTSLALVYYGKGDEKKALDTFLKVTEIDPDSERAYASLETLLPTAGERLPEIRRKLKLYSQRNPTKPLGYYLLGLAGSLLAEPTEKPEALLRKAIEVDPGFWPAYYELHRPLLNDGRLRDALEALKKVIALNPQHAPTHYILAQIYTGLGDHAAARVERQIHHELMTAQREMAELRRREAPKFSYTLR